MFVNSRAPVFLCTLLFSSSCGYVKVGSDLQPAATADAGTPDFGRTDTGPTDTGETPIDSGCTPIPEPPFPAAWPFPRTKEAYLAEFYDAMPNRATCSMLTICHGGGGSMPPLIPNDPLTLNTAETLNAAIDDIWSRSISKDQVTPPTPESTLKWNHGTRTPPSPSWTFPADQVAFIDQFIAKGAACRWKGVVAEPGQCPPPALDLSYCGP